MTSRRACALLTRLLAERDENCAVALELAERFHHERDGCRPTATRMTGSSARTPRRKPFYALTVSYSLLRDRRAEG